MSVYPCCEFVFFVLISHFMFRVQKLRIADLINIEDGVVTQEAGEIELNKSKNRYKDIMPCMCVCMLARVAAC